MFVLLQNLLFALSNQIRITISNVCEWYETDLSAKAAFKFLIKLLGPKDTISLKQRSWRNEITTKVISISPKNIMN